MTRSRAHMESGGNKINKKKLKTIAISAVIIAVLFILSSYLFQNYEPRIENLIGTKAIIGILLYVLVFAVSIVFVPISAMPLIPIGSKIWGVAMTTALSTAGWTIGAMIAFYLARRFGRPYVEKIIGLKQIEKIEQLIPEKNVFLTIFFFRTVTPFDGLSYVLGLMTYVSFKTFFWSTFLGLIPFCFAISYLGSLPTIFLIAGLALACLFLILGIIRIKRKKLKDLKIAK